MYTKSIYGHECAARQQLASALACLSCMLPHSCRRVLKKSKLSIARVRLKQPQCNISLAAAHSLESVNQSQWQHDTILRSVEHGPGSSRPTPPTPPNSQDNNDDEYLSDREWELRTGEVIH